MQSITEKLALRARYLERRKQVSASDSVNYAGQVLRHVMQVLPQGCTAVAGYAATRFEVPVWDVLSKLAGEGIATALPCVKTANAPLLFRAWKEGAPLKTGAYGIQEPLPAAPELLPDVVLVPLVAFDRAGFRLGYGGGYYDRTLEELRKERKLKMAIGIAYGVQEMPPMRAQPHDQKMDVIVTESEIIHPQAA